MFNVRKQKNLCNLLYLRENKTIKAQNVWNTLVFWS